MGIIKQILKYKLLFIETTDQIESSVALENYRYFYSYKCIWGEETVVCRMQILFVSKHLLYVCSSRLKAVSRWKPTGNVYSLVCVCTHANFVICRCLAYCKLCLYSLMSLTGKRVITGAARFCFRLLEVRVLLHYSLSSSFSICMHSFHELFICLFVWFVCLYLFP